MTASPQIPTAPGVQAETCPPPLAWQEVCKAVYESAQPRLIEFEQGELDVIEIGLGEPLVVFPGLAASPRLFFLTAWLLKDEFRCLLLGHPRWQKRPTPEELLDRTAGICAAAIGHLAPQGAAAYASSWGGQVALRIMQKHPSRLGPTILQGSWAARTLTRTERIVLQAGSMWPGSLRRAPFWTTAQVQNHRRWFPPFDETRFGFLLNETSSTKTCDVAARLQAAASHDLRPQLQSISQPVMILRCEGEGAAISRAEDDLERLLPHATTDSLSMTGHFPYLTHPHRLVKVLRNFLHATHRGNG